MVCREKGEINIWSKKRTMPSSTSRFHLRTEKKIFILCQHKGPTHASGNLEPVLFRSIDMKEDMVGISLWAWETHGLVLSDLQVAIPLLIPRRFLIFKSELRVCFRILLNWVLLVQSSQVNLQLGGTNLFWLCSSRVVLGFSGDPRGEESTCKCRRHNPTPVF